MTTEKNYLEINKDSWNKRTDYHVNSEFYDIEGFLSGDSSLNEIELALLGDFKGKTILHLQCHFGQDTLSLTRLGATVTGVDFSDRAIAEANILADRARLKADFICCDLYELPKYLNKQYDIVFTTYGTIGWLPDLERWAQVVSRFLKPNGKFVFAEFHSVVWMFDYDFQKISYDYFNTGPIVESETGTYADKDAPIEHETMSWNHGIGEVLNSLIKNGLEINSLDEFDYSPYDCHKGSIEFEPGKFRIAHLEKKIPMVYSVLATKKP